MTPCEIFAPWYSYAIADYVLDERGDESAPLNLVEFGGGNGTNMMHILDYIKLRNPELYERTNAIMVDISPAMSERQRELIEPKHPNRIRYVRVVFGAKREKFNISLKYYDSLVSYTLRITFLLLTNVVESKY